MINAPCAYQAVDSFAQCELCLSKQVRGRGIFITVKVADTDQKSINPHPPHLPHTHTHNDTPPPVPPLTGILQVRLEANEASSTLIPSTQKSANGKECLRRRARSLIAWAGKPRPGPYQPTQWDIHTPCSPMECKGHQIRSGIAPPGNMSVMIQSTFRWSIKLHDFHIK